MDSGTHPFVLLAQRFDSFEELRELMVGWDTDFRQLDSTRFKPTIFLAQVGSMLLGRSCFGNGVEQRGSTPGDMRTFAIQDAGCPEMYWFRRLVEPDALLVFPAHEEIDVFSRAGFGVSTFSIPNEVLAEFFERNDAPDPNTILGASDAVIPVSAVRLNNLRVQLGQLEALAQQKSHRVYDAILADDVQNQILLFLLEVLTSAQALPRSARANSYRAVSAVVDYVRTHGDAPLRIADLCAIAGVSERTLQNHFKRELGMTPKAYLTGQRLYGVHRQLWGAARSDSQVVDIANNWGFWHMGQFAADYRRVFGTLPSMTLKHSGKSGSGFLPAPAR